MGASLEPAVGFLCPLWVELMDRGSWGRGAATCSHGWWWEVYNMTVKQGGIRESCCLCRAVRVRVCVCVKERDLRGHSSNALSGCAE